MLAKLADSKVVTVVGAILAFLGTLCIGDQPGDGLREMLGETLGATVCWAVATVGAVMAVLGKGLADRRSGGGGGGDLGPAGMRGLMAGQPDRRKR